MKGLRPGWACAGLVCAAAVWNGPEAGAQSTAARTTAPDPSLAARATAPEMMMVPVPMPLLTPSMVNGSSDPGTAAGGMTAQPNVFSNPYAAAFFYNSMLPPSQVQTPNGSSQATLGVSPVAPMGFSPTQMGLMMLTTQRPLGIGSGQLSGARLGPGADARPSRSPTTARPATGRARTAPPPGGLAARYFNRSSPRSAYPQSYYNRQSRYLP
jgi:hypothetical protein